MSGRTTSGLKGAVAIVTGGGGGLGREICAVLAEEGARVAVADIDVGRAGDVANGLRDAGREAIEVPLDVSDEGSVNAAVQAVLERYGGLDILVNNAGIDVTAPIDVLSVADWDRVLGVNLRGPFLLVRRAVETMTLGGGGHVVNVVSTAAKRAWPNAAAYHASKWGLLGLSYALHAELRTRQIKVSAVIAGGMRTPFLLDRFPDIDPATLQDPREVAEAVRFVLNQPPSTVVPEIMVLPLTETSWP